MFEIGSVWNLNKRFSLLFTLGTFYNVFTLKTLYFQATILKTYFSWSLLYAVPVHSNDNQLKKETFQPTQVFMMEGKSLNSTNKDYASFAHLFFLANEFPLFFEKLKIVCATCLNDSILNFLMK